MARLKKCRFVEENMDLAPFGEMKDHVSSCKICRAYLERNFKLYEKHTGSSKKLFGVEIECGLNIDVFFESWHLKTSLKDELAELIVENVKDKFFSTKGFDAVSKLLFRTFRGMYLLGARMDRVFLEDELKLIIKAVKELQEFFGKEEAAHLLRLDPKAFETVIRGCRIVLLGNEKNGK